MAQRTIAIYAGRFQPFHRGHYSVYQKLAKKFGKDNVYIATSDKIDPEKSPFDFKEKQTIMHRMFGIPDKQIVQTKKPYSPEEILSKYDPQTTSFVSVVSEKDAERLSNGAYFSKLDKVGKANKLKGYKDQGYYMVAPEYKLNVNGHNISGTTIRTALRDPSRSDEDRRKLFKMLYGKVDDSIYGLVTKKLTAPRPAEEPTHQRTEVPPDARVKNPATKRDILVKTALKYPPTHPSHIAAVNYVQSLQKESVLHIRPVSHLQELLGATNLNELLLEAILRDDRRTICLINEAKSSTERVRRYYKRHPKKVRNYLKNTQDDRVARNRDRRKAVKKHGKSKMKNHDVHHPDGPDGGSWRLAKKDHGPDKKNESYTPDKIQNHIKQFAEFATTKLGLKETPKIKILDPSEVQKMASLGAFNPQTNEINVAVEGRLIADILRTLAHELTHRKQAELGYLEDPNAGKTGSPVENLANAMAGILLRDYGIHNRNIYLSENTLLSEGGAAGHMMHPFDDPSLTFADFKNMIQMALVGQLNNEAPVTEKLDGQNIAFTVKDGTVRFARNKGHVRNNGDRSLTPDELRQKFGGRGEIEHTFGEAAEDLQSAISSLPPDEIEKIFKDGGRFASVEVINPSSENIIPYNKTVLVVHNITEYDKEGNELGRSMEAGKYLADKITDAGADVQKRYGIKGPAIITMNDYDTENYKEKAQVYQRTLDHFKDRYRLKDENTLGDYYSHWWDDEIDNVSRKTGVDLAPYKKGLIQRWAFGNKELQMSGIKDPAVKKVIKTFEEHHLARQQNRSKKPFERTFLRVGSDALARTTNLLAANNPLAGKAIKKKVAEVLRQLRQTNSAERVDFLDRQVRRLGAVGFDKIVPTEGIVFNYNGKPYKFTGTFAPVNQLLGTMKFSRPSTPPKSEPSSPTHDKTLSTTSSKHRQLIEPLLHQRIKNPVTGRDIYIGTALGYPSDNPAYQMAKKFIQQRIQQNKG